MVASEYVCAMDSPGSEMDADFGGKLDMCVYTLDGHGGKLDASRDVRRPLVRVGVEERCPPRQKSRVERLKAKVKPLLT